MSLTVRGVTAPLDTIKIRLQLQQTAYKDRLSAVKILSQLLKKEGVLALWKGNVPAEIMYILYGATQFASYSYFSKTLSGIEESYNFNLGGASHSLLVGTAAGSTSTVVTYPFDFLRTRLAANSTNEFISMTKSIRGVYAKEGVRGFFAGLKPAVLSVASTTGLLFWSYELARDLSVEYKDVPFIEGFCGFAAGAIAKGLTFPLDTLRKRIQMYTVHHKTKAVNSFTLLRHIVAREGMIGLYKGFGISVLKTAPTTAVTMFFYEYTIGSLRKVDEVLKV